MLCHVCVKKNSVFPTLQRKIYIIKSQYNAASGKSAPKEIVMHKVDSGAEGEGITCSKECHKFFSVKEC
jgi:hypothetical protein